MEALLPSTHEMPESEYFREVSVPMPPPVSVSVSVSAAPAYEVAVAQQPERIRTQRATEGRRYLTMREWLDRAVALTLLILCGPLLLTMIVLVRLTSAGPAVYSQVRVGRKGRNFTIYKIRSMTVDAESGKGAVWSTPGDPRVTAIGRLLRWSHLDELPQLINILRGEMALIGPRPERPELVASLRKKVPNYMERLNVLPGVTGLAQVALPPDTDLMSVRRKTILDRQYIHSAGLLLDVHILFCTVMMTFGLQKRLDANVWKAIA